MLLFTKLNANGYNGVLLLARPLGHASECCCEQKSTNQDKHCGNGNADLYGNKDLNSTDFACLWREVQEYSGSICCKIQDFVFNVSENLKFFGSARI